MADGCTLPNIFHRQPKVCDATRAVFLDQDVLALQVSVGDGRLALGPIDLRVEVAQAAGGRVGQSQQGLGVQRRGPQVVVQGAVLVIVGDEEELRKGPCALDVRRNKACREQTTTSSSRQQLEQTAPPMNTGRRH